MSDLGFQPHDEARHARDRHDQAVDDSARHADPERDEKHDRQRDVRMVHVQHAGRVGGDAEHRPDREVDVARNDDDRLADREQGDDRRARKNLLDVRRAEEEVVVDRRRADDDDQREHDAELTEAQEQLREHV